MAFDYTKSVATVNKLLTRFGQDVTLTTNTPAAYDPTTGAASVSTATATVKGAFFELQGGMLGTKLQDGSLGEVTDKQILLAPGTVPGLLDNITRSGVIFRIVNIKEINPAGTVVMYDLVVRK